MYFIIVRVLQEKHVVLARYVGLMAVHEFIRNHISEYYIHDDNLPDIMIIDANIYKE